MKAAADAEELLKSIQYRQEELDKHSQWSESTVMQNEFSICKVGSHYILYNSHRKQHS